jgi:hypothetical protein
MGLPYNAAQRWYYFPLMPSNEALLFQQYHSNQARNAFVPIPVAIQAAIDCKFITF